MQTLSIAASPDGVRRRHILWAIFFAVTVSACSKVYFLHASVVGGDVVFSAETDLFGKPDCISSISVETIDGPAATPGRGDDLQAINRGVYWQQSFASPSCENPLPVKYGAKLTGPPYLFDDGTTNWVEAKPLLRGFIYEVSATGSGSAYASGRFRIADDGTIINLPLTGAGDAEAADRP